MYGSTRSMRLVGCGVPVSDGTGTLKLLQELRC